MVLGELASYMENPLDRSLPNYPMGRGSVASHVYIDGYRVALYSEVSKDFCGT